MKLIKILENGDWKNDFGDIDVYGLQGWISHVRETHLVEDGKRRKILPLEFVDRHPWKAVARLPVSNATFTALCPITNYIYHPVLPFAILSYDVDKYLESVPPHFHGVAKDYANNYLCEMSSKKRPKKSPPDAILGIDHFRPPSRIEKVLLGTGYTSFIMPNDGSATLSVGILNLDNNDYLLAYFWIWSNK